MCDMCVDEETADRLRLAVAVTQDAPDPMVAFWLYCEMQGIDKTKAKLYLREHREAKLREP